MGENKDYMTHPDEMGCIHISEDVLASIAAGAADKEAAVVAAVSAIDKAASKGVLHKNTAARKISRMAKRANKANA